MITNDTTVWDYRPLEVDYYGQTIEVFRKGNLAAALNRTISTIRSWERKGVLCRPLLRNGAGQWLYTRDQIIDLIVLAEEEGVIDPDYRRPLSERFIITAHNILTRLPS